MAIITKRSLLTAPNKVRMTGNDISWDRGMGVGGRGHVLYGAVQGCAAGIGIRFMPEII